MTFAVTVGKYSKCILFNSSVNVLTIYFMWLQHFAILNLLNNLRYLLICCFSYHTILKILVQQFGCNVCRTKF